jgi:hypothetical protein
MTKRQAIVFIGAAGAGKDTAADAVLREFRDARNLKFAATLKDICSLTFGWDRDGLDYDLDYKESEAFYPDGSPCMVKGGEVQTRRQILQALGTDVFRQQINEDVWLQAALARVIAAEKEDRHDELNLWVVTDARFKNEIDFLRANFDRVRVVRLVREGATQGTAASAHVSERQNAEIVEDATVTVSDGEILKLQCMAVSHAHDFIVGRETR